MVKKSIVIKRRAWFAQVLVRTAQLSVAMSGVTLVSALGLGLGAAYAQTGSAWKVGDSPSLPPLELLDGTGVNWQALRGRVVVLEFWGSWCPFCARQNPLLDQFYRAHRGRGLEVITISLDKTREAALTYVQKGGYTFKVAMSTPQWNLIAQQRRGLPQLFVLDRQGRLVMIEVREMLEEDIREIAKFL